MPSPPRRRKRIRVDERVYEKPGVVALLTVCTASRRRVFSDEGHAGLVLDELRRLHGDHWRVLGYCVMPDHVHHLVLNVDDSLLQFVRLLKGRVANTLRGTIESPLWQRSFHDHLVRRNEDINRVLKYLVENPVRAGLVSEWTAYPWSGSLQWPDFGPGFFAVNPSDVMWSEVFALKEP